MVTERSFDDSDLAAFAENQNAPLSFVRCTFASAFIEDSDALAGARFEECDLTGMELFDSDVSRATFAGCTGNGASFVRCDLSDATFQTCTLVDAKFTKCQIAGTSWTDCKLLSAVFTEAGGIGWIFAQTSLMYGDLRGLTTFEGRTLMGVDMQEANLEGVNFKKTIFEDCRMNHANWKGATFEGADLRGVDLGPLTDAASITALRGAMISERQSHGLANALGLIVVDD